MLRFSPGKLNPFRLQSTDLGRPANSAFSNSRYHYDHFTVFISYLLYSEFLSLKKPYLYFNIKLFDSDAMDMEANEFT